MAETTEIAVDASGFDRLLGTVGETTKASKEMGETLKKALVGEVLVNSINRVASGMKDGIAKEATQAAGAIAQGFFAGGPVGAALAGTAVAVQGLIGLFASLAETERETSAARQAGFKAVRDFEASAVAQADAAAALSREIRTKEATEIVAKEEARQVAARARREQNERDAIESTTRQIEGEFALKRAAEAIEQEQVDRFLRETTAMIVSDAEARARAVVVAQDRVAREAERRRESAAFAKVADEGVSVELDALVAGADEANRAIGATLGQGLNQATAALVAMDAAQIQAAASAGTLAGSLAEAAARGVSAELQAIAQKETVLAIADGAAALGRLAIGDVPGAGLLGTSSAQHAAAAVAAGAGAVALNTAASAARPATPPPSSGGGGQQSGRGGGGGGGTTIVVNTDRLFSTEADIGASIEYARKQDARYRGYTTGRGG